MKYSVAIHSVNVVEVEADSPGQAQEIALREGDGLESVWYEITDMWCWRSGIPKPPPRIPKSPRRQL